MNNRGNKRKAVKAANASINRDLNRVKVTRGVTLVSTVGTDVTPDYGSATTFRLADLPAYTEFSNTFQKYRIRKVHYRWFVEQDPSVQTTKKFPRITHALDYQTAQSPSSQSDLYQYGSWKEDILTAMKPSTPWREFVPSVLGVVYKTAVTSGYITDFTSLLDCGDADIPHYAIRYWVDDLQGGVTLNLQVRYEIELSGMR